MTCSAKGCTGSCPMCKIDHMRGMTVFADAANSDEPVETKIDLCPGARIYSYTLSARSVADPPPEPGEHGVVATFQLQDSTIELPSYGCRVASISADLPGLFFPGFAKLIAQPGVNVTLHLTYGHCS